MRERNVTHFPLREFKTLRLVCQHKDCHVIVELALDQVEAVMAKTSGGCPVCGKSFGKPTVAGGADVVTAIARNLLALDKLGGQVTVELPVVRQERDEGG